MPVELEASEQKLILEAAEYLENPTLLIQLANLVGKPLEVAARWIDKVSPVTIDRVVEAALKRALTLAIQTIPAVSSSAENATGEAVDTTKGRTADRIDFWHTLSVGATGATGGFFGMAGLPIELPLTTVVMLRSIASIAQELGEDLSQPETLFQCLTVFSLGGPTHGDDAMESSYLTARLGVQKLVIDAARMTARTSSEEFVKMVQKGTAPAVVKLIAKVAARFNVAVTQKLMAQAIPIVGALTGATINVAFMDHFNRMARFHFGIRRLERKYGEAFIQDAYRDAVQAIKRG